MKKNIFVMEDSCEIFIILFKYLGLVLEDTILERAKTVWELYIDLKLPQAPSP